MLSISVGEDGYPFVTLSEDVTLRLEREELDEEYREMACSDLRESPEIVKESLQTLKKLLQDEPGLSVPYDEDKFLYKFLRPCKFYPDSAFRLMKRFYKFKLKHPKYGSDLLPSKVRNVLCQDIVSFLPKRDRSGSRIMILQIGYNWNTKKCGLSEMFKTMMVALEAAMSEPRTQVAGVQVVIDVEGLSLNHICQFSPNFARIALEWIQECIPLRLKGIHVVNQPYLFNMLYSIFKPFISEKLRKRIYFHGKTSKQFLEEIGKESLPKNYWGTLNVPDVPGSLLCDLLCYYEKDLKKIGSYGYNTVKEE